MLLGVILIIFLGLSVYLNSLKGTLFWDDEVTVVNNIFIRHPIKYLGKIFSASYHSGAGETLNFYRPLTTLFFAFDYQIWRLNPFGYHLSNVALHILNGILIFFLLRRIFATYLLGMCCAILFLVHPINSEAVNYISNRSDLLMLFFFLTAFYSYLFYRERGRWFFLLVALVLYIFSILSKEMGLILPFFLLAYEVIYTHKRKLASLSSFGVVFTGYVILRASLLNFLNINLLTQGAQVIPYSQDIIFRSLVFAKAFLTYVRLFFLPLNLHMEYDMPYIRSTLDYEAWAILLFLLSLAVIIFYFGRKKKEIIFGQLWFIFGLLPVSGIIIPINNVVSEHYLYLGSVGFFIVIAAIFLSLWRSSPSFLKLSMTGFGAVILVTISTLTFLRNRDWREPLNMYLDIIGKTKYSFRAYNNAGVEYFRRGNFEEAEKYFWRSLEILPTYAEALNNLGVIYERRGDFAEAQRLYRESVELKPDYALARNNLANVYLRSNKISEAKKQLEETLKFYPYDSEAQRLLDLIE